MGHDKHDSDGAYQSQRPTEEFFRPASRRARDLRAESGGSVPREEQVTLRDSYQPNKLGRRGPPPAPAESRKSRQLLRELNGCPPGEEQAVIPSLLRLGDEVLPELKERFPGLLWFKRNPDRPPPIGCQASAIACALVAFGRRAVPIVAELLQSPDRDVRYYALLVAESLQDAELTLPIGRLLTSTKPDVRALALRAIEGLRDGPSYAMLRASLVTAAMSGMESTESRVRAVTALGLLREASSMESLRDLSTTANEELATAAKQALQAIKSPA